MKRVGAFYRENKILYERVPKEKLEGALKASDKDACVKEDDKAKRLPLSEWLEMIEKLV